MGSIVTRVFAFLSLHSSFFILHSSFFILLFLVSCNPTRRIPQGEYLLDSYQIKIDNRDIGRDQLSPFVRQKPNRKIFGARFHLWLYNSANPEKTNRWNEWLRRSGEEPVIWRRGMNRASVEQLNIFLRRKGYYYADITDSVVLKNNRANVIYNIRTGWAYTVNNITYSIADTSIARLILADTASSLIRRGMTFDEDVIRLESRRIETNLRNRGYFSFAADYVVPFADTIYHSRTVNIEITVRPFTERTLDNQAVEAPYPTYSIRSVKVNASLSMQNLVDPNSRRTEVSDTLEYGGVRFIIPQGFPVSASAIRNATFTTPGSLYRISDVQRTYQHLNGLRNFQLITQEFTEIPGQTGLLERELDCVINLLPLTRQGYGLELEGTNSEGNFGGGIRLLYHNRSLFGNAEFFELRLRGLIETLPRPDDRIISFRARLEYEAEATLTIPKFLLPIQSNLSNRFTQRYNPRTTFSVTNNYQQYPEYYVRTVFNTSIGYNWRGSDVNSHSVKPIDVVFVYLPPHYLQPDFEATLERFPFLRNSFRSHMIVSSSYTFIRDLRLRNPRRANSIYTRFNIESAGLLLNTFYRIIDPTRQTGNPYEMFGNNFSQFIKADIDFRYYYSIDNNNRMIFRTFAGVGIPYGNSKIAVENLHIGSGATNIIAAMPYEKKFHSGGANSMRGWRLRSLGPGSYRDTVLFTAHPNSTGDIKLEANIEYRFHLIWRMEGAVFMDAGNVWDSRKDYDRPGANFRFDRFYREIALSGGLGIRFDFNFLIIRADLGMKMFDPAGIGRWALTPKPNGNRIGWDDFNLSISIGYPFF